MASRPRVLLALLAVSLSANAVLLALLLHARGGKSAAVTVPGPAVAEPAPPAAAIASPANVRPRQDAWWPQSLPLGDSGFIAYAGPWLYEKDRDREPDQYSVSVEKPIADGSRVYFMKDLNVEDLPAGFVEMPIRRVAAYDPATRTVTFTLGAHRLRYQLPDPE